MNGDEFTNTSIDYLFSTPIFALGADFNGARTSSGFNWIIDGISTPIFSSSPGTGFFGIISSDPFTLVDVNAGASPNKLYSLDNFTSGVPEPSSLAFLALGFTIVAGIVSARHPSSLTSDLVASAKVVSVRTENTWELDWLNQSSLPTATSRTSTRTGTNSSFSRTSRLDKRSPPDGMPPEI